jgi:2-methylcitrate dehydratase PrpD
MKEEVVHDPKIRELTNKISYTIDPSNPYPKKFIGHLKVTLQNGQVLEAYQGHFRGGKEEPMSVETSSTKISSELYLWWLGYYPSEACN